MQEHTVLYKFALIQEGLLMSDNIFKLRSATASLISAIRNHYGKFLKKSHQPKNCLISYGSNKGKKLTFYNIILLLLDS